MDNKCLRIGFVMTRFAGTDGVSLEARKWVDVLQETGHRCFCFSGQNDYLEDDRSMVVPEAHFEHEDIQRVNESLFGDQGRTTEISQLIEATKNLLKKHIVEFVHRFDIELILAENSLSMPMNVPLGLALTEYAAETQIPLIAHNHDFWWERKRYLSSPGSDYIDAAFPPSSSSIQHVVINSVASRQLSFRKGATSRIIPNVMNFADWTEETDSYGDHIRRDLEIDDDAAFLLQPTRIVPRKRIEKSIELARALERPCTLVVTHNAGDEGLDYKYYVEDFARKMQVDLRFAASRIALERGETETHEKVYSLQDAYRACDLVTYPSQIEGFGNAFLETIYFKKPIVMSAYEIFLQDIQPKGFDVIEYDDYLTDQIIERTSAVLDDPDHARESVERNFELARTYYSYASLKKKINVLLDERFGLGIAEL